NHPPAGKKYARPVANFGDRPGPVEGNPTEHPRVAHDLVMPNHRLVEIAVNLENAIHCSEAGQDACLFRMDSCGRAHARIDTGLSRSVARGAVFEKSALKDF